MNQFENPSKLVIALSTLLFPFILIGFCITRIKRGYMIRRAIRTWEAQQGRKATSIEKFIIEVQLTM